MRAKFVVLGLGATGQSCVRYFQRRGIPFAAMDSRDLPPGLAQLREDCPGAELYLGGFDPGVLASAQCLIVSPGVPLTEPALAAATASGIPFSADIDLFCEEAQAPIVGITGSNAKSTVTDLLGRMARRAGLKVGVGGNAGVPALDLLAEQHDYYLLELSSFQLERAGPLPLELAVLLNFSADHLDRHSDLENYRAAKQKIFQAARAVVVNRQDHDSLPKVAVPEIYSSYGLDAPAPGQFGLRTAAGVDLLCRGEQRLLPVSELGLLGRHNLANALACLALGSAMELPMPAMLEELRRYTGLPHRCEPVATIAGIRYINDSKATNTGAAVAALEGLGEPAKIVLIAGGQGKGADFRILREPVGRLCKAVVLVGEDAPRMAEALAGKAPLHWANSMEDAVSQASELAAAGDVVLLSPACASFDMFDDFSRRGECFTAAVKSLRRGRAHEQ